MRLTGGVRLTGSGLTPELRQFTFDNDYINFDERNIPKTIPFDSRVSSDFNNSNEKNSRPGVRGNLFNGIKILCAIC